MIPQNVDGQHIQQLRNCAMDYLLLRSVQLKCASEEDHEQRNILIKCRIEHFA